MIINPTKLRLWGLNPRYTLYKSIDFQNIGKEDFELNTSDKIIEDNYESNVEQYYQNLISQKEWTKKLFELVESISEEFNSDIDEILVTRSHFIKSNEKTEFFTKKKYGWFFICYWRK